MDKKKILIASLFAVIMLIVPFTVVGNDHISSNIELKAGDDSKLEKESELGYTHVGGSLKCKILFAVATGLTWLAWKSKSPQAGKAAERWWGYWKDAGCGLLPSDCGCGETAQQFLPLVK